jgi:membrane-bound inhibitor of C-type lysozyme
MMQQSNLRHARTGVRRSTARETPMRPRFMWFFAALALVATGCEHKPSKDEEDAAKNTITCQRADERLVIRFDNGEVRMLTSTAETITLYQIPSGAVMRYSNGNLELRGKGMEWTLTDLGVVTTLEACKRYAAPKP